MGGTSCMQLHKLCCARENLVHVQFLNLNMISSSLTSPSWEVGKVVGHQTHCAFRPSEPPSQFIVIGLSSERSNTFNIAWPKSMAPPDLKCSLNLASPGFGKYITFWGFVQLLGFQIYSPVKLPPGWARTWNFRLWNGPTNLLPPGS